MKDKALELTAFSTALKSHYALSDVEIRENLLTLTTDTTTYVDLSTYLKDQGFSRCLTVAVIDWIDQGEFEIYYVVHHLESNIYVKVATRIARSKPAITSLSTIWKSATMHEREMWELFGVNFVGNTMLKPLFLENWTEKPPLRKDFNWHTYVDKEYFKAREK
ncbi:MAG: NADH-quinone oxidoreductase subunit C [Candidatus Hermodarchaeota archaeon]|nr:NADH-quinone oxidoreductase subunit C [Candidatus Hermodarchaeota archaeon]